MTNVTCNKIIENKNPGCVKSHRKNLLIDNDCRLSAGVYCCI